MKKKLGYAIIVLAISSMILAGCSVRNNDTGLLTNSSNPQAESLLAPKTESQSDPQLHPEPPLDSKSNSGSANRQPLNYEQALQQVLSLKEDGYENWPIKKYNDYIEDQLYLNSDSGTMLNSYSEVFNKIVEDDDNYEFVMLTLGLSVGEIYSEHFKEPCTQILTLSKLREGESLDDYEPVYDYGFWASGYIVYTITDPDSFTVAERTARIRQYSQKLQSIVDNMSEEDLEAEDIKQVLRDSCDKISAEMSDESMFLEYKLESIESSSYSFRVR